MNKNLLYIAVGAFLLAVGVAFLLLRNNGIGDAPVGGGGEVIVVSTNCESACAQAEASCPSLIDETTCVTKCAGMSAEAREYLQSSYSCEALTARPDLVSEVLVPGVVDTSAYEAEPDAGECESACGNYVTMCLSLVPDATEDLLNEGYESCLSECADWDAVKISCIGTAPDCPAMTDECGL